MNVLDHLKELSVPEIKNYCEVNTINSAIGMTHVSGDFNLGTVIRSANFFGYREVFYVGGTKHYDRRSTVGTHNYTPVTFIKTEEEFLESIKGKYRLISVENNIPKYSEKTVSIFDKNAFDSTPSLFLFGEERVGISDTLLDASEYILTIPSFGSVRSLNVGSTAAIVMAMYKKYFDEFLN